MRLPLLPLPVVLPPLPPGFARGCRGGGRLSTITYDDTLALLDATGDGRRADTAESNGATDEAGEDEAAMSGEGFLRFFDVGTEVGA